jgi:hypothetical protein
MFPLTPCPVLLRLHEIDAHMEDGFGHHIASQKLSQKRKAIPLQAWTGPEGSSRLKLPDLQGYRHMKVVRLSALRTGRLYTAGNISGTHFC